MKQIKLIYFLSAAIDVCFECVTTNSYGLFGELGDWIRLLYFNFTNKL